jgi:hypothetical protein
MNPTSTLLLSFPKIRLILSCVRPVLLSDLSSFQIFLLKVRVSRACFIPCHFRPWFDHPYESDENTSFESFPLHFSPASVITQIIRGNVLQSSEALNCDR